MSFTVLASVVVALGLLGYAAWLSLRVRRLAHAAETALGPRGEIRVAMPGATATDEIGDLARSFAQLLARLREHTDYLRTLSGKLSHELRTPLAVVTTSLDNLAHERHTAAAEEYLGRLRQGADRLDAILAAMSEAAQLEQAIGETRAEAFDLDAVVAACCAAYRDVYRDREIVYRGTAANARVVGSGDLVAQLLDKLIDNAVSFSPPGEPNRRRARRLGPRSCAQCDEPRAAAAREDARAAIRFARVDPRAARRPAASRARSAHRRADREIPRRQSGRRGSAGRRRSGVSRVVPAG